MNKKTKNMVLVAGFVMALVLCHKLAINRTLALVREFDVLREQEALFRDTPRRLSLLKHKQAHFDSILAGHRMGGSSVQNDLLKVINAYADSNRVKVVLFREPHVFAQDGLKANVYGFSLQGDYNALVALVYQLERKTRFGEIISLHFERKKNPRTDRDYLQVHILLKNFG